MKGVIIDINSISNFSINGRGVSAKELMEIYTEDGILFYNSEHGEKPIVVEGDVELIDFNSEEGKERLKKVISG